jgi:hypothetical protein
MANPKHSVRSLLNIASPKKLTLAQIKGITAIDADDLREILRELIDAGKVKSLDYGKDVGRLYWFNEELLKGRARNLKPKRSVDVNH